MKPYFCAWLSHAPAKPVKGRGHERVTLSRRNPEHAEKLRLLVKLDPGKLHYHGHWISPEAFRCPLEKMRDTVEMWDKRMAELRKEKFTKTEFYDVTGTDIGTVRINGWSVRTGGDGGIHVKLIESERGQFADGRAFSGALRQGMQPRLDAVLPAGEITLDGGLPGQGEPVWSVTAREEVRVLVIEHTVYLVSKPGAFTKPLALAA